MQKVLSIVLAFSIGAGSAVSVQARERVIETTIEAIKANVEKFDGKLVRVRGVFDECMSLTCNICSSKEGQLPTSSTKCLSPIFLLEANDAKESLAGGWYDEIYRHAEVTVEGRYDATCDLAQPDKETGDIIVCTDRGPNFRITRVIAVHKRWPASQGEFDNPAYLGGPLAAASPQVAAALVQTFNSLISQEYLRVRTGASDFRTYMVEDNPEFPSGNLLGTRAALCVCQEESCENLWPRYEGHMIPNPANPYHCFRAEMIGGKWVFPPL